MENNPNSGSESNRRGRNPALAAFLSIFPSAGAFYNGNVLKGLAYLFVFAILIVLQVHARGSDNVVFGLLIAGFYIYQIIDSYNEASRLNQLGTAPAKEAKEPEKVSLFWAVLVLCLGVLFQLANLDVCTYRQISRLWPLLLIAFGVRIMLDFFSRKEKEEEDHEPR